ncbi:MAG: hypothetical protein M3O41_11200 [Pseudomonadota bacterium]|nr:hypothetical protein [Pseudomonadota bacterium]
MKFLSADLESLAELIDGDQLQGQRRAFNLRGLCDGARAKASKPLCEIAR